VFNGVLGQALQIRLNEVWRSVGIANDKLDSDSGKYRGVGYPGEHYRAAGSASTSSEICQWSMEYYRLEELLGEREGDSTSGDAKIEQQ